MRLNELIATVELRNIQMMIKDEDGNSIDFSYAYDHSEDYSVVRIDECADYKMFITVTK